MYPAQKRYNDKALVRVNIAFNRFTEPDLVEKIQSVENRSGYIKRLVREDIQRENQKENEK